MAGLVPATHVLDSSVILVVDARDKRGHDDGAVMNREINQEAELQPPFADFMGMKVTHVGKDKVLGELLVRAELNNRFGVLHGGAVMALADNLGGTATIANLPVGARTATIESKTNFFAAIPVGDTARAECTPLHRGRTTMVWQTRITRNDGRLCALVTQTQIVIAPDKP
jgi:1,4-dihydroxy-2-naphthoyl-CoA hydrolase